MTHDKVLDGRLRTLPRHLGVEAVQHPRAGRVPEHIVRLAGISHRAPLVARPRRSVADLAPASRSALLASPAPG